jgi:hypothetical protein
MAPAVVEAPRHEPPPLAPPPPEDAPPPIPPFPARWNGDTGTEGAVLVRFDVESTFRAIRHCATAGDPSIIGTEEPFGHVPAFSLYEDGSVIVVRRQEDRSERVVRAQIGAAGARVFVDELVALGIGRVESHTDSCAPPESGREMCLADAGMVLLEVQLPSGKRKRLKNYAGMAKEQDALNAVLERIDRFNHESELDYQPTWSTLFVSRCNEIHGPEWPLDPAVLDGPPDRPSTWATRVPGEANRPIYENRAALGSVIAFEHEGRGYAVFLVPSLPGADPAAAAKWRQR